MSKRAGASRPRSNRAGASQPRSSRRLPLAAIALACAVFSPPGAAQLPQELQLKLERQLRLAPSRPERDSAKFIEADRIVGNAERSVVATGNVTLRQRGASIRADRVEYEVDAQTAVATGNVQLERFGDTATGPRLTYNLANDTGEMQSPVFAFPKTGDRKTASRGRAERAELLEDRQSRLFGAEYTSCPAARDDWFLRVRELDVDANENVGRAYGTSLHFLGVPILYSPFLSFPLDNRRRTGFLAPTFGTSAQSGFEMELPYYWNIAENRDATFTPKLYTRRGLRLGGELRYLEPRFQGQVDAEILPQDQVRGSDRYFVGWRHAQALGGGWHAAINAQKVSDDDYFRDLSTNIDATSQTHLPRDAMVAYEDDIWSLSARALEYQTLQDPNGPPVPIPYRIVPRLVASGVQQNFRGIDWQFFGEYANFSHDELVNGQRAILYPSVAFPVRRSYGYAVAKLGYHMSRYRVDANGTGGHSASRDVPISSLDAGLFFDRETAWDGRGFQQTLEPRIYYLHVPYRDQSGIPNFTTVESDFNFSQIFTENRFVGGDRVGDANQVTIALTTRMIESATGLERFRAALGQVYYLDPPRVTLEGDAPRDEKSSDIVAFASSQMTPTFSLDTGIQYTPNLNRSQKLTVAGHYLPVPGRVINAAYRYARGSIDATDPARAAGIEQIDFSTQWPLSSNINALARWNWSLKDDKLLEGLVGFEYNAGCWQVRAVAHRFITATQQYSTSFKIQLELSGLSRIGINPLETLRQNIPGYRRSDEISP